MVETNHEHPETVDGDASPSPIRTTVHRYLPDLVYGANDGIVTTFAIVSGVKGAQLSNQVILALGFASLLADGFSMGASDYLSERSRRQGDDATEVGTAARRALATFWAFIITGAVSLIAYVIPMPDSWRFPAAIVASIVTLGVVGSARSLFIERSWWRTGAEMLFIGAAAGAVAYAIGAGVSALTDGAGSVAGAIW